VLVCVVCSDSCMRPWGPDTGGGFGTRREFVIPITQRKRTAAADYVESCRPGTKVTDVTCSRHFTARSLKLRYDVIMTSLGQCLTLFDILTCHRFVMGIMARVFTAALRIGN